MQMKQAGPEWYDLQPETVQNLIDRVFTFGEEYFQDMLFKPESPTAKFTACQVKHGDGEWTASNIDLPEELEYFDYECFQYKIEELGEGFNGQYDHKNQTLTIAPGSVDNDSIILHEMIHLHESVLNELPLFYHDTVLFCLYRDLSTQIEDLDQKIEEHTHLFNEQDLYETGGLHDLLFLLKSFDLDLKLGYDLGTVFGYGLSEQYHRQQN